MLVLGRSEDDCVGGVGHFRQEGVNIVTRLRSMDGEADEMANLHLRLVWEE